MKLKSETQDISSPVTQQSCKAIGRYYSLKYVNAKDVLPPDILAAVQKYTGGALIYVPKKEAEKIGWGQQNGARAQVHTRNRNIIEAYQQGATVFDLMADYCLSESSIRKIIYTKESAPSA